MTKSELRGRYKALRRNFVLNLDSGKPAAAAAATVAHLTDRVTIGPTVGGYDAMTSELDPAPLLSEIEARGHRIALPWFADRDGHMDFRERGKTLEPGPFGIAQPSAAMPLLAPDTLFIPLVAVDMHGIRLRRGRGHYDRALAAMRAERPVCAIGLAWECQIADALPADDWDQPLDFILTPERLIEVQP